MILSPEDPLKSPDRSPEWCIRCVVICFLIESDPIVVYFCSYKQIAPLHLIPGQIEDYPSILKMNFGQER
jgi:hypothetical protein